jgi:hypothetical protein
MKVRPKKEARELSLALVKQMLVLATGGFSLVAALAWNDLIKAFIEVHVKPYAAQGSGITAQLIYAVAITFIAVFITLQLGRLQQMLEKKPPEEKK